MILEIFSSLVMGALVGSIHISDGKDAAKIQKICANCGLMVKEKKDVKTIQLLRRKNYEWGTEYAYRIPLGLAFQDFERKVDRLQDGLNNKKTITDITWNDIKGINLRKNIPLQVKEIIHKKMQIKKEIELTYDGTLKIRVYNQPMTDFFPYDESVLQKCKGWKIPIGMTHQKFITHDFDKLPHLIVAGTTRYGKTVFLKNVITTLITKQPKTVRFTLLDLKGGLAFNRFKNCSQVKCVAKNAEETLEALKQVKKDMHKLLNELLAKGFEDVKESKIKERHFVIIDEAAVVSPNIEKDQKIKAIKSECENILSEIARIGGGIGYRLIYSTQAPYREVLNPQIKQNCDARICFMLQTESASRVVLEEPGAESLPLVRGRAIYQTDRKVIVQTPMIENDFIEKMIQPHIVIKRKDEHDVQRREASPERANIVEFEAT